MKKASLELLTVSVEPEPTQYASAILKNETVKKDIKLGYLAKTLIRPGGFQCMSEAAIICNLPVRFVSLSTSMVPHDL